MSWQIREVLTYGRQGKRRVISFHPGKVNIITGKSYTGKSSLIEIIDYCLGGKELHVSSLIRSNLAWVGLLLQLPDRQVFMARETPPDARSSINAMFLMGDQITAPQSSELRPTTNIETVVAELSKLLGISPNKSEAGETFSRDSFSATLRHASRFLFQPQDVLPSKNLLFYKQSDQFIKQSIIDTLPYFLGAVREDRLKLEADLAEARRLLRQLQRRIADAEQLRGEGFQRLRALAEEAVAVGLLKEVPATPEGMYTALGSVMNWTPELPATLPSERLATLQDEFEDLSQLSAMLLSKIRSAQDLARELHGYGTEARAQVKRLEVVELFGTPPQGSLRCPICDQEVGDVPTVSDLRATLQELASSLEVVEQDRPNLRKHIEGLTQQREEIEQKRGQVQLAIMSLLQEQEASKQLQLLNERRARVVGRVSLFLEGYSEADDASDLRLQAEKAKREVARLEALLDPDERDRRLDMAVNLIGHTMTTLGAELEFEHKGKLLRFDPKRLMIHIDSGGVSEALYETGSAANYVSLHLVMFLALHKFFLDEQRPIPHFLVIDQPSQAYYEPDPDDSNEWRLKKSDDRLAVEKIYDLLFSAVSQFDGGLQIIVLDHADLKNHENFQQAVVQRWRGNEALIPYDWLGGNKGNPTN